MTKAEINRKLKQHGLRLTDCRVEVLEYFEKHRKAIAHAELEENLPHFDRVTLYRTLTTFTEKGLIHKIPDFEGADKYAICAATCDTHHHHDEHVHFKCVVCNDTTCLEEIQIPKVSLPKGFETEQSSFLVEGTCKNCAPIPALSQN